MITGEDITLAQAVKYEGLASAWWCSFLCFGWAQNMGARYVIWKATRKHARYMAWKKSIEGRMDEIKSRMEMRP